MNHYEDVQTVFFSFNAVKKWAIQHEGVEKTLAFELTNNDLRTSFEK